MCWQSGRGGTSKGRLHGWWEGHFFKCLMKESTFCSTEETFECYFYVESNRGGFVIMEIKDDQSTYDIQDTPNAFA